MHSLCSAYSFGTLCVLHLCICLAQPGTFCLSACSAELATKLQMLEGKLLHGERRGGLDKLARDTAAQLSQQKEELRRRRAAEAEAARRIAALEASAHAVQTQYSSLQVCGSNVVELMYGQGGDGNWTCWVGCTCWHLAHPVTSSATNALLLATRGMQEEAEALTAQIEAAAGQYEAARAELGDVYAQWEQDREELVEQIRWGEKVPALLHGCARVWQVTVCPEVLKGRRMREGGGHYAQ